MPNLQDFSLIQQRVKDIQKRYSLESPGEAFDYLSMHTLFRISDDLAQECITDGSMDEGIDGIYIVDQDIHFVSCKYTDSFENSKKNFPEEAVDKLSASIKRIMEKSLVKESVNEAVWEKAQEIWQAFDLGPLNIHVHFISNKEIPVRHAQMKLENDLSEYRNVIFYYWDSKKIADKSYTPKRKRLTEKLL